MPPVVMVLVGVNRLTGSTEMADTSSKPTVAEWMKRSTLSTLVKLLVNDATQHIPLSQAQAGDLVFFHSTYNTSDYVTHVGIYVGNNQMYHAGNPIGYTDLTSAYWQQHIICAGRIKQ